MVAGSTKELKEISAEKFTQKKDKAKMAPTVADSKIWFQAHRGGLREAPGNTMTPFRYGMGTGRHIKGQDGVISIAKAR